MTDEENTLADVPEQCQGTTGPLSKKKPEKSDIKLTQELEEALRNLNVFESPDEVALRRESLLQLQDVCNAWIHTKTVEKNFPPHKANSYAGKVYTFGSYRLGVNTKGADIDALLVAPRFISREEFFDDFAAKVLQENPNVEDLHAVPEAYVPVLKMKFFGVEIDLLFARVDLLTIPPDFDLCERTETLLRNMSEQDVRSVNGVRVTEDVLRLVHDKDTFKTSLKVIRMWARRRGLYSNSLGFLGGVSWAILVARICQLFPLATPATVVIQFFMVLSRWVWPRPIMLKHAETLSLGFPVWDPRININDQYHVMPIITPSYPSQNSTYNVYNSSKTIIMREILLAEKLVRKIVVRKEPWSALFVESMFFTYRHYVVVMVTGTSKNQFMALCGLVESKLRLLVNNFEQCPMVEVAHVNSKSYGRCSETEPELIKKWFVGMQFRKTDNKRVNIDLSFYIQAFEKSIGRGVQNEDLCDFVAVKYAKKSQLEEYLPADEFAKMMAAQPPPKPARKRTSQPNGNSDEAVPEEEAPKDSPSAEAGIPDVSVEDELANNNGSAEGENTEHTDGCGGKRPKLGEEPGSVLSTELIVNPDGDTKETDSLDVIPSPLARDSSPPRRSFIISTCSSSTSLASVASSNQMDLLPPSSVIQTRTEPVDSVPIESTS